MKTYYDDGDKQSKTNGMPEEGTVRRDGATEDMKSYVGPETKRRFTANAGRKKRVVLLENGP